MSYSPNFTGNKTSAVSTVVGDSFINNSGGTLTKATPVRVNTSGEIESIDVSVEAEAIAIAGVVKEDISDTDSGTVVSGGRVEDITTTAVNGDVIYLSKTGGLTNTKPSIGAGGFVAGDFVIKIGVIFKNELIPAQKDLLLNITLVGQL